MLTIHAILAVVLVGCVFGAMLEPTALSDTTKKQLAKYNDLSNKILVLYHLGSITHQDVLQVAVNNVRLFVSAVLSDKQDSSHRTFYVFTVNGGTANPLQQYLPSLDYSVNVKTSNDIHDLQSHMQIISSLDESVLEQFKHVIMLSSEARGPFENRKTGLWWKPFTDLLASHPTVGLVGPMMTCEGVPAVQTYAFAMPSNLVRKVFALVQKTSKKKHKRAIETAITVETQQLGKDISSLLLHRRYNATVYKQDCIRNANIAAATSAAWCDLAPREVVFVHLGINILHNRGHYCQESIDRVVAASENVGLSEPQLHLSMPETLHGGRLYSLYKEYTQEVWRGRFASRFVGNKSAMVRSPGSAGGSAYTSTSSAAAATTVTTPVVAETVADKVCLIVRASGAHNGQGRHKETTTTVQMDLPLLIQTLLRQNSTNWEAYFVVTDDVSYETELQATLALYEDSRLVYLPLDAKFRSQTSSDRFLASDEALRQVMLQPQCAYLSVTDSRTVYGSTVIGSVLAAAGGGLPRPQLITTPMDSEDLMSQSFNGLRAARGGYKGWSDHCTDFEQRFNKQIYGFAVTFDPTTPVVVASKGVAVGADVSAVFFERNKFKETGAFMNDFKSKDDACAGCQGALWVQAMGREQKWTSLVLPLTSLAGTVFRAPSPLWCVAAGHVWFDRPEKAACLPHGTVTSVIHDKLFDWEHYHAHKGLKICLRLSHHGYALRGNATTFFE